MPGLGVAVDILASQLLSPDPKAPLQGEKLILQNQESVLVLFDQYHQNAISLRLRIAQLLRYNRRCSVFMKKFSFDRVFCR